MIFWLSGKVENVDIGNIACKGRLNSEGNAEAGK